MYGESEQVERDVESNVCVFFLKFCSYLGNLGLIL